MDTDSLRVARLQELARVLGVRPDEDVHAIIDRAMPTIEQVTPRARIVLDHYYGREGRAAATLTFIGNEIGGRRNSAHVIRRQTVERLAEALRTLRCERMHPNEYGAWTPDAFFTMERAVRAGVQTGVAQRICRVMRYLCGEFSTVDALCAYSERYMATRIPNVGASIAANIQRMLQTEGLSLASRSEAKEQQ